MTQALYAHMNNKKKENINLSLVIIMSCMIMEVLGKEMNTA
jgi:hypothetical protein